MGNVSRTPLRLAIPCSRCGAQATDSLRTLWFLRGRVMWATYGKHVELGCESCVRKAGLSSFARNLFLGWWCVPWGLFTFLPFAQNVFATFPRGPQSRRVKLTELFENVGFDIADLELGDDGLTAETRRLVGFLARVLRDAMAADGEVAEVEFQYAVTALVELSGGVLTPVQAKDRLLSVDSSPIDASSVDVDARIAVLEVAISVTLVDGSLAERERHFVFELGRRMELPESFIEHLLHRAMHPGEETNETGDLRLARVTLGVDPSCTLAQIKQRYRELIVRNHPATVNKEERKQAAERTRLLNWSYNVLREDVACQVAVGS